MSYLEFETRAAEKAELQDLLLRLQDAHVEGFLPDWINRWVENKRRTKYVSSKEVAKTCLRILKDDAVSVTLQNHEEEDIETSITTLTTDTLFETYLDKQITFKTFVKFGDTSALLIEFWKTLQKEHKDGEAAYKLTTVRNLANQWQFLERALQTYQKDETRYTKQQTKAVKTDIAVLFVEMDVFRRYWKNEFKLAN